MLLPLGDWSVRLLSQCDAIWSVKAGRVGIALQLQMPQVGKLLVGTVCPQVGGNGSWKWEEKYWETAYESVQLTNKVSFLLAIS